MLNNKTTPLTLFTLLLVLGACGKTKSSCDLRSTAHFCVNFSSSTSKKHGETTCAAIGASATFNAKEQCSSEGSVGSCQKDDHTYVYYAPIFNASTASQTCTDQGGSWSAASFNDFDY